MKIESFSIKNENWLLPTAREGVKVNWKFVGLIILGS